MRREQGGDVKQSRPKNLGVEVNLFRPKEHESEVKQSRPKRRMPSGVLSVVGAVAVLSVCGMRQSTAAPLTLEDCVERAVRSSPAAQVADLRFAESSWSYHSHRASLRPILTLRGTLPGLQRSIDRVTQDDGSVRSVEQNRILSSLGLSLDQELPMTGGRLSLTSNLSRTEDFGDFDYTDWQASALRVRLDQPVFGFNSLGWDRKTEPLRFELARSARLAEIEGAAADIADRFFRLYVAQVELDNAAANAAVNDTIFTLSQGRYEIGKIAENDLLQSELAFINAQTELADLEIEYERALRDLKIELGLPYNEPLEIAPPLRNPEVEIDPTRAVELARQHRPDFMAMELEDLQAEESIARARTTHGLTADITASYGLNQSAPTFEDAYRDPLESQGFDIGFQVPLLGWGRNKAAVEGARAGARRVRIENDKLRRELDQEVYFEATQFDLLTRQLRTAAKADTVAERRFDVARNRYLIGKIGINELFDAQREKDSATTRYIQTLRSFWIAFYRIRQLTLFDFVAERPLGSADG